MSLETAELLHWRVVASFPSKMLFTLNVFTDSNHRVTGNFVCGRSQSVGLWSFSDARKMSNTSYSWQMSLVFLALMRASLPSCQRFSES